MTLFTTRQRMVFFLLNQSLTTTRKRLTKPSQACNFALGSSSGAGAATLRCDRRNGSRHSTGGSGTDTSTVQPFSGEIEMMIKRFVAFAVLLAFGFALHASELRRVEYPIEGRYIVVLKEPAGKSLAAADRETDEFMGRYVNDVAVDLGARFGLGVEHVYSHALAGFSVSASEREIHALLKDPRVAYVEEDGMVFLDATQSNATWGLDRIDQRNRPLNGTYIYDYTASNVRAYVIDSGIRASHNQFGGRVLSGASYINDGRGTNDCNGHGTHVAGTIGGSTHGVAKQVRLVPVRVFGCTGGSSNSTIVAGINWVAANRVLPAVANMSLGGGAATTTDNATNNLISRGVSVVVAAGNSGANACNYSPARVANAITVGSTTSTDARSSFSNFGSCVNIFAPGSSITSAWHTSNTATNTISGTSMASPHVAGVAALWLGTSPSATPAAIRNHIYSRATTNVLSGIGSGSPNRLLYSR
ncbi:MAG TPA: S8 family peptidase [Xanthomonadaceae bacterium]|nr:S8 family peptidase [Xanthomonadaceae bacterium]